MPSQPAIDHNRFSLPFLSTMVDWTELVNHEVLRQAILDQRSRARAACIVPRSPAIGTERSCLFAGIRHAGKSALMAERMQRLVADGISWDQIVCIDFEDVRLSEFQERDFSDIVETAAELSSQKHCYFFDEMQHIEGWGRFACQLASRHESICIACSTKAALKPEASAGLEKLFEIVEVMPFSFAECLDARGIPHTGSALHAADTLGKIQAVARCYLHAGGFPEASRLKPSREQRSRIYQHILESDVALEHQVRKPQALSVLMKKAAESLGSEMSISSLRNAVCISGQKLTADAAADYLQYAEDAYLLFRTQNYIAYSAEGESTPRWYFGDDGILDLFLFNKDSLLLENAVALALLRRYGKDHIFYFKSSKTGIDIDFYVPEASWAIQVCHMLDGGSFERETGGLAELAHDAHLASDRSTIVTFADSEQTLEVEGASIEVLLLWKFLLDGQAR